MSDILNRRLVPSSEAAESAVGDETVILNLANGTYYGLDPTGTQIWAMLKDGTTPADICDKIAQDFDASIDVVKADIRKFLSDLEAQGIVADG